MHVHITVNFYSLILLEIDFSSEIDKQILYYLPWAILRDHMVWSYRRRDGCVKSLIYKSVGIWLGTNKKCAVS